MIRTEGLTKRYRSTLAVDRLDLAVGPGMVFGFLGPNGSVQPPTMRLLLGLIPPPGGRGGRNGRAWPDPAGLSRVGGMIEEPAFYPWLTGRRNLEVLALSGPRLPGETAIDAALERVDLTGVASRKVKTFS